MRILLDQNLSFKLANKLKPIFGDVFHIKDFDLLNTKDSVIWQFAKTNNYSIISFDSDFYDISILNGYPPKIIWIRTFDQTSKNIEAILINFQKQIIQFLSENDDNSCLEILDKNIF
jgi:predicted nuclease of predicted toxin-antitoxin system